MSLLQLEMARPLAKFHNPIPAQPGTQSVCPQSLSSSAAAHFISIHDLFASGCPPQIRPPRIRPRALRPRTRLQPVCQPRLRWPQPKCLTSTHSIRDTRVTSHRKIFFAHFSM